MHSNSIKFAFMYKIEKDLCASMWKFQYMYIMFLFLNFIRGIVLYEKRFFNTLLENKTVIAFRLFVNFNKFQTDRGFTT